jgi:predicted N-acetyltransferase YhbS
MTIRSYQPTDYEQVAALYRQSHLYGGHFDGNRDGEDRLRKRIEADPDAILVAEQDNKIVGTVSLIEDGRVAWLFRFAVQQGEQEAAITKALCDAALTALKAKGHNQVLVYTPVGNDRLDNRYESLGFIRGGDYTCYWKDI